MIKTIKMPKYGLQQDEGTVVRWARREGERVEKGEVLCEIETDKALFDFEAPEAGIVRKVVCEEGLPVPVLSVIAILSDTAEESIEGVEGALPSAAPEPRGGAASATAGPAPGPTAVPGGDGRAPSSPAARRRARELGVDLSTVKGTGPGGRITEADVEQTAASPAAGATARREPLSKMRRAIARAMTSAKQTIPHFYLDVDVDMTDAEAWWKANEASADPPLTLTDLIVKAAAVCLAPYPALNASLDGDDVVFHDRVNIGLAVGTDDGLLVPVLADAAAVNLRVLARDRKRAVDAARQGRLHGEARATFTISNLGMFGIKTFSAIINPPEVAALAVGAIRDEVRPLRYADRETVPSRFGVRRVMTVTLSADHRLVDGVVAARYLQDLKRALETAPGIGAWV